MNDRSKREIDEWVDQHISGSAGSDVDLSDEEARVIRKQDMIRKGIRPDDSLTIEERDTLQRIATRSP